LKSAGVLVESDEFKVIALGSFIESKIAKRLLSPGKAGNVARSSRNRLLKTLF
jgi:hypothetical protein